MLKIKSQTTYDHPAVPATGKAIKTDVLIKNYLQSYLSWMVKQNPVFSSTLTPDEISNYFFHSLIHPLWFMKLMEKQTFKLLILIDNYFRKYMNSADLFCCTMVIIPKISAPYKEIDDRPVLCDQPPCQGLAESEWKRLTYDEAIFTQKLLNL